MSATITYLGGPETGNVDKLDWGGFTFEKDKPFKVDLRGKNPEKKETLKHILAKARTNRFFKVDGKDEDEAKPVVVQQASAATADRHEAVHGLVAKPGEPVT
jgi:hypothetical protein